MNKIKAKCKDGATGVITASGKWLPCCNFHLYELEKELTKLNKYIFNSIDFDIKTCTKYNFYDQDIFKAWVEHIEENYHLAPHACKFYCSETNTRTVDSNFWCKEDLFFINSSEDLEQFVKEYEVP